MYDSYQQWATKQSKKPGCKIQGLLKEHTETFASEVLQALEHSSFQIGVRFMDPKLPVTLMQATFHNGKPGPLCAIWYIYTVKEEGKKDLRGMDKYQPAIAYVPGMSLIREMELCGHTFVQKKASTKEGEVTRAPHTNDEDCLKQANVLSDFVLLHVTNFSYGLLVNCINMSALTTVRLSNVHVNVFSLFSKSEVDCSLLKIEFDVHLIDFCQKQHIHHICNV